MELHVNLWQDLPDCRSALDLGFMISSGQQLGRFFLFIPARIERPDLRDLSHVMKCGETLSAVFNDIVSITADHQGSYEIDRGKQLNVRVHNLEVDDDIDIEHLLLPGGEQESVIVFKEQLCDRLRSNENHYIRIRLELSNRNIDVFSSDISPKDGWLLSSFYKTELNEFRFNERRSFPARILEWSDGAQFHTERILYFLIRSFNYELSVQHAQFQRTRRLEPGIWTAYLSGKVPSSTPHNKRARDADVAANMLIYQWKETAKRDAKGKSLGIRDFSAFAAFRVRRTNTWFYLLGILALGAAGNGLHSTVVGLVQWWPWTCVRAEKCLNVGGEVTANSLALLLSAAGILLIWLLANQPRGAERPRQGRYGSNDSRSR